MTLKEQKAAALARAQKAAQAAKAGNRPMNEDECREFDTAIAEVERLSAQIASAEGSKSRFDKLAQLGEAGDGYDYGVGGVKLFTPADETGFKDALAHRTQYRTDVPLASVKAAIGSSVLPTVGSTISANPPGTGAVALRNLLIATPAESQSVRYYRIGAATAGTVAEGGLKPDSGAGVTPVDAQLLKVANLTQLTDELLEDAPGGVISAIQSEALMGVIRRENVEIVNALTGASGVQVATGTLATGLDVIASAIGTAEATNGLTPDALLINPANLATLRQQKASTSGVPYLDPFGKGPSTIHGVPIVSTPAVAAGTVLLVTRGAALFYERNGLRVDLGFKTGDFENNLRTLRVEERVLPAVVRPVLIHKLTLT